MYRKALAVREKAQVGESEGDALSSSPITGISTEDQIEVIYQINEIISKSRIKTSPETFSFTSQRSGIVLPILINLLALAAILAGVYLSQHLFRLKEESLVSDASGVSSAEGKLLEAVRQESEEQINSKDREIADIQKRLTELNSEREQLKSQMDEQFRLQAGELEEKMVRRLAEEKERLQGEGLSSEELEQRMRTLEAALDDRNKERLDRLRAQMESELAQKESAMDALIKEQTKTVEQARLERMQLQKQYQEREAALTVEFQEREKAMESEQNRLVAEYDQFRQQKEKEDLAGDFILSTYGRVHENLAESNYEQALTNLKGLQRYLLQDSVAVLPAIRERRPVELFIIGSLTKLVEAERQGERLDSQSLVDSADLLNSVSSIVAEADDRYRRGDIVAARELYLSAVERIPAVQSSYQRLRELDNQVEDRNENDFEAKVRSLESELVEARKELSGQRMELARARAEIQRSARKLEEVRRLKQEHEAFEAQGEPEAGRSPEELRDLLHTKLLVKEVLVSEPVRSQHPQLYDQLEQYLDAFGEERAGEGEHKALRDVIGIVDQFGREQGEEELQRVWERYQAAYSRSLLLGLLEALEELLE